MKTAALILAMLLVSPLLGADADLSTPKSAAKALWAAVDEADREKIQAVLFAENDQQRDLIAAFADLLVSGRTLETASREKFGKAADKIARPMIDAKDASKLDTADVKESGDAASLTLPGGTKPMNWRKSDGRWRLIVTDYGNASPANLPGQIKLLKSMSAAMTESAKEIRANKYADVPAAEAAIQQKLHAVMIDSYRPASGPATAPTSAPTAQPQS
jgi:hypothetical protein